VKAAANEIMQILKKQVWRGVIVKEEKTQYDSRPIPSSMKIKEKYKGGLLEELKGRLTAGGHKQCKETFRDIKYAPTVSTATVMCALGIAAAECRAVGTLDFTGAFLCALMPTDRERATLLRMGQFLTRVFVKIDSSYEKYVRTDGTCVVVLEKALYGIIIAAAAWYKKISGDMKDMGYEVSKYDNCVFNKNILGL
jgi:Reverse transcriptase (RNA-dependent DNA polymerase)